MSTAIDTYLTQWLKVATKGSVTFHRSFGQDRYQFGCNVCQATLTVSSLGVDTSNGIDYTLQQFVQIHAHVGGHVGYNPQPTYASLPIASGEGKTVYSFKYNSVTVPPPTPVTMDFKKVKPKNLKLSTGRKFR